MKIYEASSKPVIAVKADSKYGGAEYHANNDLQPGFEFRYGRFGLALSPSLWGTSQELSGRPPTHFFDARAFHYGGRWGVDGYYQHFRGFHANFGDSLHVDNPSMSIRSLDVNVFRSMTKDSRVYRMQEGLGENGVKADFLYLFGFSYQSLGTRASLLYPWDIPAGTEIGDLRNLRMTNLFIAPGLSLCSRWFGFYFDTSLFTGFGPQYRETDIRIGMLNWMYKAFVKADFGIQGESLGAGMSAQNDANSAYLEGDRILFHSVVVAMFLSLRL